jgi:hypothetical protein
VKTEALPPRNLFIPLFSIYMFLPLWNLTFLKMCAKLGTVPLMWVSVHCELLFHSSKQHISKLYSLLFWLNNSRQNTGPENHFGVQI